MKKLTIALIVLLALTMGMASCSHESPVPFLEEMGICTDSLLVDSFPNPFYYEDPYVSLDSSQCKTLGLQCYCAKIVSAKQFKDNYLLNFFIPNRGLMSVLYDNKGKALDECLQIQGLIYPSKERLDSINKGYIKKPRMERYYETDKLDYLVWERHYVDSDKFEVVGTSQNTDTIIKYLYKVANDKITQISRSTTKNIKTVHYDIISLPISQTYQACDIMSKNPIIPDTGRDACGALGSGTYIDEINLFATYNTPAILKWILDHREKEDILKAPCQQNEVIEAMWCINAKSELAGCGGINNKKLNRMLVPSGFIKSQILQIKDKESQQYLLKVLIRD